jgi:hypothetical protein
MARLAECGVSIACGTVLGLDLDIEDAKLARRSGTWRCAR